MYQKRHAENKKIFVPYIGSENTPYLHTNKHTYTQMHAYNQHLCSHMHVVIHTDTQLWHTLGSKTEQVSY